jgi:membrane-bound inhibitor of C-type lysozyme
MKYLIVQPTQWRSLLLITSLALLVSGCATTPTPNPVMQYQCDGGTQLNVVLNQKYVSIVKGGRGGTHYMQKRLYSASVTMADGTMLELPAQKVTSGFFVSNGQYTLRGKGSEAKWAVAGMAVEECVVLQR